MTADIAFDWSYRGACAPARALYAKAVDSQWSGRSGLDWSIAVDPERPLLPAWTCPLHGCDVFDRLSTRERDRVVVEYGRFLVSQLLHGEQGALLAASRLVAQAPDLDSKLFAASQVADEARHVEVFARYVEDKLGETYPPSGQLTTVLGWILEESRWDMNVLGTQVMIEGLALATLGAVRRTCSEPLLQALVTLVLRDEARHVSFSVYSLRDAVAQLDERGRREREDFVYEVARRLHDDLVYAPLWQRLDLPLQPCVEVTRRSIGYQRSRRVFFGNVARTLARIDLLTPRLQARLDSICPEAG
jgi:hypothetical protein